MGEELRSLGDFPNSCSICGSSDVERDYMAERPVIRPDWPAGFNYSIGMYYSGRRDLMTKMRASGHYPIGHGGSVFKPDRTYYGEEEYYRKFIKPPEAEVRNMQLDALVAKGIEDTEKRDRYWVPPEDGDQ